MKPKYIMIGGFLGAGKTTSIAAFGKYLTDNGLKVGLITNDQANGLVDTAMLRSQGFATEEIAGGCFCCRFSSLTSAADKLTESTHPDVFLAEPVGSCTDLVATVTYPLRRLYGENYHLTPFSVLVDPVRAARVLNISDGRKFSTKVEYIYRKQLEEAHAIVINKADSVSQSDVEKLREAIDSEFPGKQIFVVSARNGTFELTRWFDWVMENSVAAGESMDIDYDTYADGEALLGWLNATIDVKANQSADRNAMLKDLSQLLQKRLNDSDCEIAHLKMTFSPHDGIGDIAIINTVRNDIDPNLSQTLEGDAGSGELVLNLRAEGDPSLLQSHVEECLRSLSENCSSTDFEIENIESFRPGRPVPEHRDER